MHRDERGAVAVVVAFSLAIFMAVSACVLDIGMLRVARADMQSLADVVALDLSRDLDGRTVAQLQSVMDARAGAAIARNGSTVGSLPTATVELGSLSPAGAFVAMASSGVPTAVRVRLRTQVPFAFAKVVGEGEGTTSRSATSTATSNACFRLGSFVASLRSGDSALAGVFESMLGSASALGFNLHAIGYMGLVNSSISIDALAATLGFGTPEALVEQGNISVKNLLTASAQVLTASGDSSGGVIMSTIASKVSTSVVANVADILSVGGQQAAGARINAIDLLGGAALGAALLANVADHNNLLHTGVVWSAPHASNGDIALTVIEAPRQGCGMAGATATTGQVGLTTAIGFNLPNTIAGLADSNATDPTTKQATLDVDAQLGGASGTLTGTTCTSSLTETRVRVSSRLTRLSVRLPFQLNGTIATTGIVPASLIPSGMLSVQVQLHLAMTASSYVQTAAQGGTTDTVYDVPPHNYLDPQPSVGASSSYLGLATPAVSVDLASSTASLVGKVLGITTTVPININLLNLSSIVSAASSSVIGTSVATLVSNLNDALTPVAELLGIRFAGADLFGVPTPVCARPRLVG